MKLFFACFIVLLMSFMSVHADLNGVWIDAKDIRTGTFGSDESGGDYIFPNNLDVSNRLTTNQIISTTASISSFLETTTLNISGNAGSLKLIGLDHTYLEFYPQGSSIRKGWVGYGTAGSEVLSIQSEEDNLALNPSGNYVGIGTQTPRYLLDVDGTMNVEGNSYFKERVYINDYTRISSSLTVDGRIYSEGDRVATEEYVDSAVGSAPIKFDVYDSDTSTYACVTKNLENHCGDEDGCTIRLLMQHETNSNDRVRVIDEMIFMEQPDMGTFRNGRYGWTRQQGGGDYSWITGTSSRYTLFSPWDWVWAYNYQHRYCVGGESSAHSNPYEFTFMSHPHIKSTVVVYD